jgi:signal peptidase I
MEGWTVGVLECWPFCGLPLSLASNLQQRPATMPCLQRLAQQFWRNEPCRWCLTVASAACLGIAGGKTVLGISGSVSVVDGQSMEPTYGPGARVYMVPVSAKLRRGDIVLLQDGDNESALKRIVGLPKETVCLWRGYVFINRRLLREPYLPKHTYTFPDESSERFVFVLGPDEYFVLGDNRTCSIDSRSYGPVETRRIKSRVPVPESYPQPSLTELTLPDVGKRTIRPLEQCSPARGL